MPFDSESTVFIGSKLPAKNGYGQNGYHGASSDLPGKHTTSGFLPQVTAPKDPWQTRNVSKEQYPTTFGCAGAKAGPKITNKVSRKG